jgi:hypothetical protein
MTDLITNMSPTSRGVNRPLWGHTSEYIGGPLDGQRSPVGWHGLRRDDAGNPLRSNAEMPPHYVLYRWSGVCGWSYVHTSKLIKPDENCMWCGKSCSLNDSRSKLCASCAKIIHITYYIKYGDESGKDSG